jgi:hypothetical protein
MKTVTSISAVLLLLISIMPAHAYIDAGSGSYLFQIALAGILAAVYSIKLFWQRIKTSISGMMHSRNVQSQGQK